MGNMRSILYQAAFRMFNSTFSKPNIYQTQQRNMGYKLKSRSSCKKRFKTSGGRRKASSHVIWYPKQLHGKPKRLGVTNEVKGIRKVDQTFRKLIPNTYGSSGINKR